MDPKEKDELKGMLEDQAKEIKGTVDAVTQSQTKLDGIVGQLNTDIEKRGKELSEHKESFVKQVELVTTLEEKLDALVEKMTKLPGNNPQARKSLGQMAAESDNAKNYKGGNNVLLAEFDGPLIGKIDSTTASGGTLVEPIHRPGILTEPDQPLTVRDLLTVLPISTNAIEWVQELLWTSNAASQTAEGAEKAESTLTFEKKTSAVETIAHWIRASKQILADAPALRAFIDQRLVYGLKLEEEEQLLTGDGTNGNLDGLIPNATAFDTGLSVSGDTIIDQLRRAILQANLSKYPTTGIVLSPTDWCNIELAKTTDNGYLFSNPTAMTTPRLWGKRVVESLAITDGTFLAGAFGLAATLWDREQVNIRVSEHHADFFIKNMVAILCEERIALTVERPLALVTGTLAATA